ncbi:chemerin-like receptor 1 [Candoia aspera]|uniref:chemerin-like receptor 1 n=1 Tax=Candoia aspera TaxID=51853 RepID=UPI002FD7F1D9
MARSALFALRRSQSARSPPRPEDSTLARHSQWGESNPGRISRALLAAPEAALFCIACATGCADRASHPCGKKKEKLQAKLNHCWGEASLPNGQTKCDKAAAAVRDWIQDRRRLEEVKRGEQDSLSQMENVSISPFETHFTPGPKEITPSIPDHSLGIQKSLHLLSIVVYGVACLLGVTGNGLVIWIAGFKMEKTVNVVWFLNLALADFVFTLFLPLSITYTALGFHWPFGKFLCKLNSTLAFLNMFASVFLLTVISLDRCVSVVQPVWSRNHRTPRLAWGIVLATWVAALLISSPYFLFRDTAVSARNVTSCYNNFALSHNYTSEESRTLWRRRHKAMIVARFLFGFLLPATVIVVCHGMVAFRLQRRRLARSPRPFRIIVAVTATFFLCYSPYHTLSLLEMAKASGSPAVKRALHLGVPLASSLAFFNSCLNPLLYVFVGQKSFRRSIRGAFEGAFGEDSILSLSSRRKSRAVSQTEIHTV